MKKALTLGVVLLMSIGLGVVLAGCGKSDSEELHVYNFGDYLDTDLIEEFESETGIKVVMDTFDTNEEMYPVIKNNSADYDVICASDYMIEKMIGEDLLSEIDYKNVPNIKNISGKYLKIAEEYDPGNKYSVPHTWGTMGILYNSKEIKEGELTSWNDLWKEKYKGQIVMPDSMRDAMAIALKAKGYSLNTTDEEQVKEASDYLIKQQDLVYKYANDSARDLLLGGSANIAVIWNGEVLYCQESNPDVKYVIPKEGTEEFIDSWAIPKTAKNKKAAEKWINFMADKDVAKKNFDYLTFSIPNEGVIESLKDDAVKQAILFPDDSILANCETLKDIGAKGDDLYSKYWKKFKAE